jgi:hypothetical protein
MCKGTMPVMSATAWKEATEYTNCAAQRQGIVGGELGDLHY